MKKTIALLLCIALAIPTVLTSCDIANLFNNAQTTTPAQTTPEGTTPESTTPEGTTPEQTTPEENTTTPQPQEPVTPPEDVLEEEEVYQAALSYLNLRWYEEAYELFLSIPDYADVPTYLSRFSFRYSTHIKYARTSYGYTYHYEYDAYGKQISGIYTSASSGVRIWEYQYNADQKRTHYIVGDGYTSSVVELYEYDAAGNLVRAEQDGFVTLFEYDANGNVIKRTFEDDVSTFQYDTEGRLIQEELSNKDGVYYRLCKEYDAVGNHIKTLTYYGENLRLISVGTYTYDENGNVLKYVQSSDGEYHSTEYTYDENGNLIKQVFKNPRWGLERVYHWEYDEHGNKTKEVYINEGEEKYTYNYAYEYDTRGNCIKETFTSTDFEREIVRTYEYDEWGNLTKETAPGETDNPDDYVTYIYSGYKLYYNPYEVQDLPTFGK